MQPIGKWKGLLGSFFSVTKIYESWLDDTKILVFSSLYNEKNPIFLQE